MADAASTGEENRRALNRADWGERVPVHRAVPRYNVEGLKTGQARLNAIEEAELGPVAGLRVLHLQCHFGRDSLILASRGADVTGLDFSAPAIEAARADAAALGLKARFMPSDVYAAREAIPEPASFDLVYTTWGTICWLPDVAEWARVIAHFLRLGDRLYFADMHPAACVPDDMAPGTEGRPGWFAPYFEARPLVIDDPRDYADPNARLRNQRTAQWMHPLSTTIGSLLDAGMRLDRLREHPRHMEGFRPTGSGCGRVLGLARSALVPPVGLLVDDTTLARRPYSTGAARPVCDLQAKGGKPKAVDSAELVPIIAEQGRPILSLDSPGRI